jgi:mRNA interferase RelE/StbE
LGWRIEISETAESQIAKLDKPVAKRILNFLRERLVCLDDPRSIGEALNGEKLGSYWKYRVGDYRIISSTEDRAVRIVIVRIGNRRDVYR